METAKNRIQQATTFEQFMEIDGSIKARVSAQIKEIEAKAEADRAAVIQGVADDRERLMRAVTGLDGFGGLLQDHTLDEIYEAVDVVEEGDNVDDVALRLAERAEDERDHRRFKSKCRGEYYESNVEDDTDYEALAEAVLAIWLSDNDLDADEYAAELERRAKEEAEEAARVRAEHAAKGRTEMESVIATLGIMMPYEIVADWGTEAIFQIGAAHYVLHRGGYSGQRAAVDGVVGIIRPDGTRHQQRFVTPADLVERLRAAVQS
jgi:hypothetical protein